jgi:hypothetical protein
VPERLKRLHPDEYAFAYWLSRYRYAPPVEQQLEKIEELLQVTWTEKQLSNLKKTKAFREYFAKVCKMTPQQARKIAQDYIKGKSMYVAAAHMEAIEHLKKLGEWKELAKFTTPLLDRIEPKSGDQSVQATQINITLTPAQQAATTSDVVEVEAEVIDDGHGGSEG